MHEAQTHEANCFLTLTYDDLHLPLNNGLDRDHVPSFLKRLRKAISPTKIRYFQCGEYGSNLDRPHYHLAIFGYGFPDRKRWTTRGDHTVHRSEQLEQLWDLGFSEIGSLTFKSAAYIARYVTKKIKLSEYSSEHARSLHESRYERLDPYTGEIHLAEPEHATMSLKPGIGEPWYRKYWTDVYPADQIIMNGKQMRPPRYYDRLLAREHPDLWETVRRSRAQARDTENTTPERLRVSEIIKESEAKLFQKRN